MSGQMVYIPENPASMLEVVSSMPRMPHARCREAGMAAVFDAATSNTKAQQRCLGICASCVHAIECRRWVLGLAPSQRPFGVVGQVVCTDIRGGSGGSDEKPAIPAASASPGRPKPPQDGRQPRRRKSRAQRAAEVALAEAQRARRRDAKKAAAKMAAS